MKKKILYWGILPAAVLVVIAASYATWNRLDPNYTCARCHEISTACAKWEQSVHADVTCTDCHGTALESFNSMSEKLNMVYKHFTTKKTFEDIHLTEKQSLALANRCAECHQAEQASWMSGAHSTTYKDIFMDVEHNKMERPYWDCFRCHGMFYDGDIDDLMAMEGGPEDWHIKDASQMDKPAITCLACHQVHHEQPRGMNYKDMDEASRGALAQKAKYPPTALYMRADKRHMPADKLLKEQIFAGDSLVAEIKDANTLLCMQCHAPGTNHQLGSEDDKTTIGDFKDMSCITCHDPHSNQLKTSHRNVHKKLFSALSK